MARRGKSQPEPPPLPLAASIGPAVYLSRELSSIAFNRRVLELASDLRQPLLERLKFTAVFGSNTDEFFMLRVAELQQRVQAGATERGPAGMTPAEELAASREALQPLLVEHQRVFSALVASLAAQGIAIVDYRALRAEQKRAVRGYFEENVFPVCTPLGLDPGHPFPLIANLSINLAVVLDDPDHGERFAFVRVPDVLPRLIAVPDGNEDGAPATYVWLEQVVAAHLERLFPGVPVAESHPFRVIRGADLEVQTPEAGDLLEIIEQGVSQRRFSAVVAMMIHPTMSERVRALLDQHLGVTPEDVWVVDGPLGLGDLMELYSLDRDDLKDPAFVPHTPAILRQQPDPFAAIRAQDILLRHPYDSYTPVVDLLHGAALDPHVLAIKQTLYRVGKHSTIVDALREAADRGKEVAVLMELTAQGDETSNIEWARTLEHSGVHVTYGLLGLKTHGKVTLVVRRENDGLRRYLHLGTGNYNPETARRRTDFSLFTCDPAIGADVSDLFNHITGYSRQTAYRKLLVAPGSLRQGMIERIEREIAAHQRTGQGRLLFKMNALVDPGMVAALCRAAQAGVQVDLIVRGICTLRPAVPGVTERIRVMSVVGRFLEHSRAYYFHNGGQPEVLIGSADLMPRNLDKRVEVLTPVESEPLKATILSVLETYLRDNQQSWELTSDGTWVRRQPRDGAEPLEAQVVLLGREVLRVQ